MDKADPRSQFEQAKRLMLLREAMGYGGRHQARYALFLGLTNSGYNHFEQGRRPLSFTAAQRIADRTGVTIDWLVNGNRGGLSLTMLNQIYPTQDAAGQSGRQQP